MLAIGFYNSRIWIYGRIVQMEFCMELLLFWNLWVMLYAMSSDQDDDIKPLSSAHVYNIMDQCGL
jgi:hypothetical protein